MVEIIGSCHPLRSQIRMSSWQVDQTARTTSRRHARRGRCPTTPEYSKDSSYVRVECSASTIAEALQTEERKRATTRRRLNRHALCGWRLPKPNVETPAPQPGGRCLRLSDRSRAFPCCPFRTPRIRASAPSSVRHAETTVGPTGAPAVCWPTIPRTVTPFL